MNDKQLPTWWADGVPVDPESLRQLAKERATNAQPAHAEGCDMSNELLPRFIEAAQANGGNLGTDAIRSLMAEAWNEGQRAWEDELLSKTSGTNPYETDPS